MLQSCKGLGVAAKVVEDAGEKCGGRDGASHHDDVEVGGDFLGRCGGAFGVEDVVHEVSTVGLESEASMGRFMLCLQVPSGMKGRGKDLRFGVLCRVLSVPVERLLAVSGWEPFEERE